MSLSAAEIDSCNDLAARIAAKHAAREEEPGANIQAAMPVPGKKRQIFNWSVIGPKALAMKAEGISTAQIGKELGVPAGTMWAWLKKNAPVQPKILPETPHPVRMAASNNECPGGFGIADLPEQPESVFENPISLPEETFNDLGADIQVTEGYQIQDSGDRYEFESGAVRDMATGKGRCDLLPPAAILRLARHFEAGAVKYGERNWEKGIPLNSFIDSAFRHICKYMIGMQDEDHLVAAAWNLMCALETEERFGGEFK